MPNDSRKEFASPPAQKKDVAARPFPPAAYVLGWLAICLVGAEGVNSLISGLLGTGIILICLVPVMIWVMHVRPHRQATRKPRG